MRCLIALILMATPAALAEDNAYQIAFTEGRYADAAELAQVEPTADRLAFTARSTLADGISSPDYEPPPVLLDQAEHLARKVLELDPTHLEGRLQLAIALSLKSRTLSVRDIRRSGYGEETKALAEGVLKDDPDNTYAHGFLAVWHLEVRRRGGTIGASIMGASVKKGRRHYQAAISRAPQDASLHWQYARALTALNAKKYRNEISQALTSARQCATETSLEQVMQDRAVILQSVLETKSPGTAEQIAAKML
jgi:hypothetical protein